MDQTRAISIGWPCKLSQVDLLGTANLAEFDTIIWHPERLRIQLLQGQSFTTAEKATRASERLNELNEWVSAGHTLIAIMSPLEPIRIQRVGAFFSLVQSPPLRTVEMFQAAGQRIEFCGPPAANEVFAQFHSEIRYQIVIKSPQLRGLLRVHLAQAGPEQLVAGYLRLGKGLIVFVPAFGQNDPEKMNAYALALLNLTEILAPPETTERPDWVDQLWTSNEAKAHDFIERARAEVAARNAEITEREVHIANETFLKELFFSTGDTFHKAVASAFDELGIKIVNGPHPRADLIGFDGTVIVAIEAKGVEGSARERDLRQVDAWKAETQLALASTTSERREHQMLSDYATQIEKLGVTVGEGVDIDCKGIMVIGTFRSTALPDRVEKDDFPIPVLNKIKLSRVCALSGLQLYNLVMLARIDPGKRETIRKSLFETEGVLPIGNGWQTYLTRKAS